MVPELAGHSLVHLVQVLAVVGEDAAYGGATEFVRSLTVK
jgi:hypothetical protein